MKKGAHLLKCGKRGKGKPKFCAFRLSSVSNSGLPIDTPLLVMVFSGVIVAHDSWLQRRAFSQIVVVVLKMRGDLMTHPKIIICCTLELLICPATVTVA
jgi:hypothetical protein